MRGVSDIRAGALRGEVTMRRRHTLAGLKQRATVARAALTSGKRVSVETGRDVNAAMCTAASAQPTCAQASTYSHIAKS